MTQYTRSEDRETTKSDREDRAVLRFIASYVNQNGYPPSRRELLPIMGKTSPSEAQGCIQRLYEKGLIDLAPGRARGMRITASGMIASTEEM